MWMAWAKKGSALWREAQICWNTHSLLLFTPPALKTPPAGCILESDNGYLWNILLQEFTLCVKCNNYRKSPLVSQPIFWFYHHHRHCRQPISGKWRSDTIQDNWLHRIIDAWGLSFLFPQSARTLNVKFFDQANFSVSYRAFVRWSKPDAIYVIFTVWWDDARVFAKKEIRICIQETNSSSQGFHNICCTKQLCNSNRQIALEKQGMQRARKDLALIFSSNKEKLLRTYIKVLFRVNWDLGMNSLCMVSCF